VIVAALLAARAPAQVRMASIPCAADVTIYSESGSAANGAGENLFVGANSNLDARRSLVRFDIGALVPPGSIVVSAALAVTVNQGHVVQTPITARRVLAAWVEGPTNPGGSEGQGAPASGADVTWTLRDFAANSPWTTPGADFASSSSLGGVLGDTGNYVFDVSPTGRADIQSWLDQPAQNFGWALVGDESSPSSAKRLDSRSAANAAARPELRVTYFAPGAQPAAYCTTNPNSSGALASIASSGSTSFLANSFTLLVSGVPASTTGTFFFGSSPANPAPFGDGFLCIAGSLRRVGMQPVGALGTAVRAIDNTTFPGSLLVPGAVGAFQFWFRDFAAGNAGFSASDGLLAVFSP
jgi:hypothetical protein